MTKSYLEKCLKQPAAPSRKVSALQLIRLTLAQEESWKNSPYGGIYGVNEHGEFGYTY
jgi:hypothetical protein